MKKMKFIVLLFCLFLGLNSLYSQTNDVNDLQFGVAVKATVDFNLRYPNFNIGAVGGIGGHPFDLENIYPSVHAGFIVYNHGELMSAYDKSFFGSTVLDGILDITLNLGLYRQNIDFSSRFVPLYHFADFTPNPLQNPFQSSFSLGTNFIVSTDDYRRREKFYQRIGFTNLMIDRHLEISVINDGTLWRKLGLADGLNRYYAGGVVVSYHLDTNNTFDNMELSIYEFKGHETFAFDTARLLQLDFIPFKEKRTYFYNKNRLRFSLGDTNGNYGFHATLYNVDRGIPDLLHVRGNYSYHLDNFNNMKGSIDELLHVGLGGYYFNRESKFTN